MIVYLAGFGSMWFRKNHPDGRSAWINTTGVPRSRHIVPGEGVSSQFRRRWTFPGSVRFEANNFPWVGTPKDLLGVRCYTQGIETLHTGENRIRMICPAKKWARIDAFLLCIRSSEYGRVDREGKWKATTARLIAASGGKGGYQELLLLVQDRSWFRTSQGFWQCLVRFRSGRPRIEIDPMCEELEDLS
jgi:hypothetical protein